MQNKTIVSRPQVFLTEPGNPPVVEPIYLSSAFTFDEFEDLERLLQGKEQGYLYSRISNPTTAQLESTLMKLQKQEAGLVLASGVAAITISLYGLLQSGDTVVMFLDSYKTSRDIIHQTLSRHGIRCLLLPSDDRTLVEKTLHKRKVKAVLFESPSNPMTKLIDIEWLTHVARKANVYTILDNTFAGVHQHGQFDVDIFVHSLTKFVNGHGDVFGGAILGRKALIDQLRVTAAHFGACLDAHAAFLISRGLRTYFLRYTQHSANALSVAQHLEKHPKITKVYYPGLKSHPQHDLATSQMSDFGGILAAQLDGSATELRRFFDELRFFSLTGGLGSIESLIAPISLFYGSDLTEDEKELVDIQEGSFRVSVGLEDERDLIEDLDQALARV